jgi:translation initiation factor 2 beta subunit (eIF-2beta)/eIF-5
MSDKKEIIGKNESKSIEDIYDIEYLLDRAYGSFSLDKSKIKIVMPVFAKKDRKSYIYNFQEVCRSINRSPDDVRIYLGKELNMDTSIKENGTLKIDGMPKTAGIIEKFIKEYVIDYVMCKACKSCKTNVKKVDRINFLVCETCKSKQTIKIKNSSTNKS